MSMEDERELDLQVAELHSENRMLKERNAQLTEILKSTSSERYALQAALERILAVSNMALRDRESQGTGEVGQEERPSY
jgi:hypothetical protein